MTTQTINTGWLHGRLGTLVLWALLIATESAGQLFTKVAGDQLGPMDFSWQWLADVARNPGILAAIASYLGAFFVWMLICNRYRCWEARHIPPKWLLLRQLQTAEPIASLDHSQIL